MDSSAENSERRPFCQDAILLAPVWACAHDRYRSENHERFFVTGVLPKFCAPLLGGILDYPTVFPGDRKISQMADGRIMKQPTSGEFFIIEVMGIS